MAKIGRKEVEELAWRLRLAKGHAAKAGIIRYVWEFSPRKKRKTYLSILAEKLGMTLEELYIFAGIDIYRKFRRGKKYGQERAWAAARELVRGQGQSEDMQEIWCVATEGHAWHEPLGTGKRGKEGGRNDRTRIWKDVRGCCFVETAAAVIVFTTCLWLLQVGYFG